MFRIAKGECVEANLVMSDWGGEGEGTNAGKKNSEDLGTIRACMNGPERTAELAARNDCASRGTSPRSIRVRLEPRVLFKFALGLGTIADRHRVASSLPETVADGLVCTSGLTTVPNKRVVISRPGMPARCVLTVTCFVW